MVLSLSVLAFFSGIVFVQQFSTLLSPISLVGVALAGLVCVILKYFKISWFLGGIIWATMFAQMILDDRLIDDLQGKEFLIEGEIIGLPQANSRRTRFDFEVTRSAIQLPEKIRLSWYYPKQRLQIGQRWRFFVKLKAPHGSLNAGGFDYEKWLFSQHIGATGYIRQADNARLLASNFSLSVVRQQLIELLSQQQISRDSLALVKALALGYKSEISREQWRVLSHSGTNHLMAISGLHIGLVAGFIYFLARWCWLRLPMNRWFAPNIAMSAALVSALGYAFLAGFAIPTQRALIMLIVVSITLFLKRHSRPLDVLLLALGLIVLLNPLAVLSSGLYLSFAAVAVIMYSVSARLRRASKLSSFLKIQAIIGLSLLPILLLFFQSVSLIAPLANLLAVPVVSFIVVPLSLLAVSLLSLLPECSALLLVIVDEVLTLLWTYLSYLVELPFAYITLPKPDTISLILAILGMLLLLAPRGIPMRYLAVFLLAPLFLTTQQRPLVGEMWLTLLDVGQGLSVVIETAEHQLVFDTGAKFSEQFDMGNAVLVPFLKSRHIEKVDTLIISHADNDHIGGAESLLAVMPVDTILSSVPEKLPNAKLCKVGMSWYWDGVKFEMLSPTSQSFFDNENDNSCVLKVSSQYGSVLLTGDIEAAAEQTLVASMPDKLAADVLIASHHGSKTSSSEPFLAAVQPEIILIPADSPNRFHFPHKVVLERYQAMAAKYYVTGEKGALAIKFNNEILQVKSYREEQRAYWHK